MKRKETVRQRMIGMMYIVLTALLAMNVSSSVLEKFAIISKNIETSTITKLSDSEHILDHIKSVVSELGNRKGDVDVLTQATLIHTSAVETIKQIETIKNDLIKRTGGIDKITGHPKNLKNETEVFVFMLTEGKAKVLQKVLNDYSQQVRVLTNNSNIKNIALDAKDIDLFKNDPNQKNKNFGELNFEGSPLGAALATLNIFANEVISMNYKVLQNLARSIGADDIKFDKFNVVVKPNSMYVASGTKYEGEMFLTVSSSGVNPNMYIENREISVSDGVGKISFPVSGKNYDKNGVSKQKFKASIVINNGGKETVTDSIIDYYVVKPVIQVQSASVQALYLNCGNELNVQVPSLGMSYNPRFVVKGGEGVLENKLGYINVIPKEREVKLEVYNGSDLIDVLEYKVRTIPKPDIRVVTGAGVPVNEIQGMRPSDVRILKIKAVADEGFSSFLPKDARYKVVEWEVTLARGTERKAYKVIKDSDSSNISDILSTAASSDRLIVEVKKVVRINFQNVEEVVLFPSSNIKIIQLK